MWTVYDCSSLPFFLMCQFALLAKIKRKGISIEPAIKPVPNHAKVTILFTKSYSF